MRREDIKMDIKKFLLEENDLKDISKIADKYSMSLKELGQLIIKGEEGNYIRKHIRFGADEITEIDRRAGELNMERNDYIRRCYLKALEDELYMNMDIKQLKKDTYKGTEVRNIRVAVYFKNPDEYTKLSAIAKKFSMQFSTLIRHFALCVKL